MNFKEFSLRCKNVCLSMNTYILKVVLSDAKVIKYYSGKYTISPKLINASCSFLIHYFLKLIINHTLYSNRWLNDSVISIILYFLYFSFFGEFYGPTLIPACGLCFQNVVRPQPDFNKEISATGTTYYKSIKYI